MINSRDKGARNERLAAKFFMEHGIEAARGQQKSGGVDSPDIRVALPGVHVEVKAVERLNIWEAMAQAVRDAAGKLIPWVMYKRNRGDWWISQPAAEAIINKQKADLYDAASSR